MTMNAADVAKTIQLIIAPVVLITACALIQNAILMRYAAVGQYMRSLALERLQLLRSNKTTDPFYLERFQEIDRQIPLLIQCHRLLQKNVLLIYGSISIFLMNMFAIALTVALGSDAASTFALMLFLLGTGVLLSSVFLTTLEIRMSHQAICYEVSRITMLKVISE
jgi:alanine-alpha-ketoisovalerate/valine-pyruvate aminotransferase